MQFFRIAPRQFEDLQTNVGPVSASLQLETPLGEILQLVKVPPLVLEEEQEAKVVGRRRRRLHDPLGRCYFQLSKEKKTAL